MLTMNGASYQCDVRDQVALGPYNTVDGLCRVAADRADGKGFRSLFFVAIITFRFTLVESTWSEFGTVNPSWCLPSQ